jgi:DNA-directed RNA polymerase specialized sigma24 family protein
MAPEHEAARCGTAGELRFIRAARAGDRGALGALVRAYEPLIERAVSGLFAPGLERDELRQVGRVALLSAVTAWDSTRAPVADFAYGCVRRRALTAVTAARRLRHAPLNDAVPLEHPLRAGDDHEPASALVEPPPLSRGAGVDPLERILLRERLAELEPGCRG